MATQFSLAIHGGAGTILRSKLTSESEASIHSGLLGALQAGHIILSRNGTALDAVTAAVAALENDPLFNAGRGSVFTRDGKLEMDAAIMDGSTRRAGAVGGLFGPRNPILAARAVMERTEHVMLVGPSAAELAREAELPFEPEAYFFTQSRWDALQATLDLLAAGKAIDDDPARRHGTVGAVAKDAHGNLAAATSTGGITAKMPGRVGDTPIIGAGTFADNATCAVSGTGHGEMFIRYCVASEISARMRLAGETLPTAAEHVVMQDLFSHHGEGGVIAVDSHGYITMPFNCEGMYRGHVSSDTEFETLIFR